MKNERFEELYKINVNDYTETKNNLTYLSWTYAWSEFIKRRPDADYEILKFENNQPYTYDENTGYMVFTKMTDGEKWREMWLPVMDGNNKAMLNHSYTYKVKEYKNGAWTGGYTEKSVEKATMFDINKTIMRCLVKNIAMFGLGLYIYSGEDMPEGYEISKEEAEKIIINFGKKHPGETLKEIAEKDQNYLLWLVSQEGTKPSLKEAISKIIYIPTQAEKKEKLDLLDELSDLILTKGIDREKILKYYKVKTDSELTIEQLKNAIEKVRG